MGKLLECVLNFSEGTDSAIIEEVVASAKPAKVLDLHSDPDHNRSVVTMIGDPQQIFEAAFNLTRTAVELMDVTEHAGVHPYIGVVDVIPFIPLREMSLEETCRLAHDLGARLWNELNLPVYFYGEAAKIAERKELPFVRKGGFSLLKTEIDKPERKPDIGHGLHHSAGATAVGVRDILIAFNVELDTVDIDLARSIARNIREKEGGLPGVRAMGVTLASKGRTQVTINITRHKDASLKDVFDEVTKWAHEYQVPILCSELVGLVPQEAVFPEMQGYLKLPHFSERQILENHL